MRIPGLFLVGLVAISGCNQSSRPQVVEDAGVDQIAEQNPSQPDSAFPQGPINRNQESRRKLQEQPARLSGPGSISFGTTEPTIIDTRTYAKQVYRDEPFRGEDRSSSSFRPVKEGRPGLSIGPANALTSGGVIGDEITNPQSFFPGITMSPWTPPDPALAVGPDHVVQTVNMELAFFSKETGELEFQQQLDSTGNPGFFEEVGGGTFCFDPKCFYDPQQKRFYVLALEVYGRNGDVEPEAWITFAVSDDDNPHGIWYKYRTYAVVEDGDTTYWVDYPGLGFDNRGFYVTGNLFRLEGNGSGFGGVLYRSFDMRPLLRGDAATWTDVRDENAASVQVAQMFGRNRVPLYVSVQNSSQLRLQTITNALTNPQLVTTTVDVPQFSGPPQADNSGGQLSVVGSRIMNVHYRDGLLYTCHTVSENNGQTGVARWYEIDTGSWPAGSSPVLMQSGVVDLGGGNHTFFPAIYSNDYGNIAMVMGKSAAGENPSVHVTGRLFDDALGTMRPTTQLVIGDDGHDGRWGDYFDIAVDPVDGRTFWTVGEFQTADNGWATTVDSFTLEEQPQTMEFKADIGTLIAGTIDDLDISDDSKLEMLSIKGQTVRLFVQGSSPISNPNQMWFVVESQLVGDRDDYEQIVELRNYQTDSWEVVQAEQIRINRDFTSSILLGGDLSRFVDAGSGELSARITLERLDQIDAPEFNVRFDRVHWVVAE